MAIKLNEITNFAHKKTAMLSGADFRLLLTRLRHLEKHTNKKSLLCKQAFKDFYGLAMIICFSLVPTWLLTIQTHRTTSDVLHAFLEPEYKYQEYSSLEL